MKGLAIDCAAHGEPFCIIFWPNAFPPESRNALLAIPNVTFQSTAKVMALEGIRSMFGLEVMVTGLTGCCSTDIESQ